MRFSIKIFSKPGGISLSQNSYVFETFFRNLPDTRLHRRRKHDLQEVLAITICAVVSGADGWNDVESYGRAKESWLRQILRLENGVPSHDTFRRIFSLMAPWELERCFDAWIKATFPGQDGDVIAIDGKTLRRSHSGEQPPVHIVSAWSTKYNAVLAQEKVANKAGELTAIPLLLDRLPIHGNTITIDALGCQTEIAAQILKAGANYVLSLKANQPTIFTAAKTYFEAKLRDAPARAERNFDDSYDKTRRVRRIVWVVRGLSFLETRDKWPGLESVVVVESTRMDMGPLVKEVRFFISSLNVSAKEFGRIIRSHWGIENKLHWSLDVSFREDESRLRYKNSAQNFSVLRRIALNLIRQHQASRGIMARRRRAGWDDDFLDDVLRGISPPPRPKQCELSFSDFFLSPAKYKEWSESTR